LRRLLATDFCGNARLSRICSADVAFADTTDGMFPLAVINGFTMVDAQLARERMRESPDDVIAFGGGLVRTLRALAATLMALGIVAGIGGMPVEPAFAGVRESAFFVAPGGASVVFDVRDVPRRQVVERLLAGRAVVLEWLDDTLADEPITGVFNGNAEAVLQRLLAQTNFVVVYDRSGDQPRISRLTILGKAAKPHRAPELAGPGPLPAPSAPPTAAAVPAPPASPMLIPPPSSDRAAPPPMLPSAGATPPNLVPLPPPPGDIFFPLRPPPADTTPPKLVPMSSTQPPPLLPAPGARQR
jgi:hypothetical protein